MKFINILFCGDKRMRINKLEISGIGGIKQLTLNFTPQLNVICGANGIGKTTILKIISDAFSNNIRIVKRNAEYKSGKYKLQVENANKTFDIEHKVEKFAPNENEYDINNTELARDLLRFNIERNFDYVALTAVSSDPRRRGSDNSMFAASGVNASDLKLVCK